MPQTIDKARSDLVAKISDIFTGDLSNNWASSKLEKTYFSSKSHENAMKAKVELVYCKYSMTTTEGDLVTYNFVFFVCVSVLY